MLICPEIVRCPTVIGSTGVVCVYICVYLVGVVSVCMWCVGPCCQSPHGGVPSNTPLVGGVANGSTRGPDHVVETRQGQSSLVLDLHFNNRAYTMHTVHTSQKRIETQVSAILHGQSTFLGGVHSLGPNKSLITAFLG